MDIKKEIGQRIYQARKGKGLTRKALADLTDDLKPSRISNWEYGMRTPGPEEVKQLSKALDVSPAFLMCLTEKMNDQNPNWGMLVPILDSKQACDPMAAIQAIQKERENIVPYVPFSFELTTQVGKHVFAVKMPDDSMEPELRRHDILLLILIKRLCLEVLWWRKLRIILRSLSVAINSYRFLKIFRNLNCWLLINTGRIFVRSVN